MWVQQNNDITPVVANASTATGNAALTASINPGTGQTAYAEGFDLEGAGATAASVIEVSITGLNGGTVKREYVIPAGATTAAFPNGGIQVRFPEPLPATGPGVEITISVPAFGSGNTNAAVTLYGFTR